MIWTQILINLLQFSKEYFLHIRYHLRQQLAPNIYICLASLFVLSRCLSIMLQSQKPNKLQIELPVFICFDGATNP